MACGAAIDRAFAARERVVAHPVHLHPSRVHPGARLVGQPEAERERRAGQRGVAALGHDHAGVDEPGDVGLGDLDGVGVERAGPQVEPLAGGELAVRQVADGHPGAGWCRACSPRARCCAPRSGRPRSGPARRRRGTAYRPRLYCSARTRVSHRPYWRACPVSVATTSPPRAVPLIVSMPCWLLIWPGRFSDHIRFTGPDEVVRPLRVAPAEHLAGVRRAGLGGGRRDRAGQGRDQGGDGGQDGGTAAHSGRKASNHRRRGVRVRRTGAARRSSRRPARGTR